MTISDKDYMLCWVSLVHAGQYLPQALSAHLHDELGITLAEQDLMKQIQAAGGGVKMAELAQRIFLSKAGLTKMVDRLETAGLVSRNRSRTDRRVIELRLTRSGSTLLRRSWPLLKRWVRENLRDHISEVQLIALKDALRQLLEGHGRWEGQLAHLRGEGQSETGRDRPRTARS